MLSTDSGIHLIVNSVSITSPYELTNKYNTNCTIQDTSKLGRPSYVSSIQFGTYRWYLYFFFYEQKYGSPCIIS